MNPTKRHPSADAFDMAQGRPAIHPGKPGKPGKPYTPPAILHELALETRAGSALGVDPMNQLFGTDSQ